MTILEKKRIHVMLFIVGAVVLSITAEKCRLLVGEEAASKSGKFTFLNCFDGSSGTLACLVKEGVKLYVYNIRALHVETRRNRAIESALADAVDQGMNAKDAAKVAQKEGAKAAKLATRKVKRIVGPIISSGWDFFEALYFGGTLTEGFLRGTGTLFGTYSVGFVGEQRFGKFGYLVGSHLGSWIGGRIGLMVYDVVNGIQHIMQFAQWAETQVYGDTSEDNSFEPDGPEESEMTEDSYTHKSSTPDDVEASAEPDDVEASESPEDSYTYESFKPDDVEASESPEDSYMHEQTWSSTSDEFYNYETPPDESFDAHEL